MTLVVRTSQMQQMGDAAPGQPVIQPCRDNQHWIEVVLLDKDNEPIPGEHYELRLPDQSLRKGRLNREGSVKFEGIVAGDASIAFPGIDAQEWAPL